VVVSAAAMTSAIDLSFMVNSSLVDQTIRRERLGSAALQFERALDTASRYLRGGRRGRFLVMANVRLRDAPRVDGVARPEVVGDSVRGQMLPPFRLAQQLPAKMRVVRCLLAAE
jgi:hypothetical protein